MDSKYIVAIEIGSSKIHGAVAQVQADGSLAVLASESLRATGCVRYGRVSNVQEVSTHVNNIMRKLENHPAVMPRKISEVYVGLGGRSFSTLPASASIDYGRELEITSEAIKRLKDEARFGITTTKNILDMVPRRFFVNNKEVTNMVGTVGRNVRAEFTALLCAQDNRNNLERIKLDSPHLRRKHYVLRPTAIADMVLDTTERQLGCILADIGAETTTVMIYKDGALQFASTLPLGSRNITLDLKTGLSLTEDRAEQVKITLGNAINERHGSQLTSEQVEINQYVQARTGEIIANIIHQVEAAGFKFADLPGGIIVTGGGSRLRNFTQALTMQAKAKSRTGAADPSVSVCAGLDPDHDIDIIALLRTGAHRAADSCLINDPDQQPDTAQAIGSAATVSEQQAAPQRKLDDSNLLDDDEDIDEPRKAKSEGFFSRLWTKRDRADHRRAKLMEDARRHGELERDDLLSDDEDPIESPHGTYDRDNYRHQRPEHETMSYDEVETDEDPDPAKVRLMDRVKIRIANFLKQGEDREYDDQDR